MIVINNKITKIKIIYTLKLDNDLLRIKMCLSKMYYLESV
jgi:hypothetical protein